MLHIIAVTNGYDNLARSYVKQTGLGIPAYVASPHLATIFDRREDAIEYVKNNGMS